MARVSAGRRWRSGWKLGHISWAVPLGLGGWAWSALHDAGQMAGLATAEALCLMGWVPAVLVLSYGLMSVPGMVVPRRIRKWYRRSWMRGARPHIPVILRRGVYAADRSRCVYCGSGLKLQLDHIFPWSLGGLTSLWNMAVLCGRCNRVKSNYWRFRSGYVVYRSFQGSDNALMAAEILACERRVRWNMLRWMRAALALGVI
jgi:HNH endonuclease